MYRCLIAAALLSAAGPALADDPSADFWRPINAAVGEFFPPGYLATPLTQTHAAPAPAAAPAPDAGEFWRLYSGVQIQRQVADVALLLPSDALTAAAQARALLLSAKLTPEGLPAIYISRDGGRAARPWLTGLADAVDEPAPAGRHELIAAGYPTVAEGFAALLQSSARAVVNDPASLRFGAGVAPITGAGFAVVLLLGVGG